VEGARPDSFQPVRINHESVTEWYKDDESYFLTGKRVTVDYPSFEIINEAISCDKEHVYITKSDVTGGLSRNKVLVTKASRPIGTSKSLGPNYAQIGNSILLSNWKTDFSLLPFIKIDSVSAIDERRIVVNGQLVSDGVLLPNFNVSAFVNLDRDHIRDNQNVYYNNQKIEGADAATFEVPYENYSKDKNHVYYKGAVLQEARPSSFVLQYNTGIATDGQHQYKDGVRIK
ncbi:MAG: DKNYY domain-containing protein, partial [Flammeovirgaceae bacterium]